MSLFYPNRVVGGDHDGSRVGRFIDSGTLRNPEATEDYSASGAHCEYRVTSKSRDDYTEYFFQYSEGGDAQTIAKWRSDKDYPTTFTPLVARHPGQGDCWGIVQRLSGKEQNRSTQVVLLEGSQINDVLVGDHSWSSASLIFESNGDPIAYGQNAFTIERVTPGGSVDQVVSSTMYDWGVAIDDRGYEYVTTYDYEMRTLQVSTSSPDNSNWETRTIGRPESGWHHSLAMHEGRLYVLYYYYRNAFNRGLRVAVLEDGKREGTYVYERSKAQNLGWEPVLGIHSSGRVKLSYLENVQMNKQVTDSLDGKEVLESHRRKALPAGWEAEYSNHLIVGGAKLAYSNIRLRTGTPTDDPKYKVDHTYQPAQVLKTPLEFRYGSFNLGISYFKNLVGDKIESTIGEPARWAFERLSGYLGFDKLFFGHDVRVTTSVTRYPGEYSVEGSGTGAPDVSNQSTETKIRTLQLALISQRRISYGFDYRRYGLLQPVYSYFAPKGEKQYRRTGSALANVDINRIEAFVGYDSLDYFSKYENEYWGFLVEGRLGAGLAFSNWEDSDIVASQGTLGKTSSVDLALSGNARLGYGYYKRFYGLRGAGLYLRGGYQASAYTNGVHADPPDDRNDEEDELENSKRVLKLPHAKFFHGPFVSAGLVY